MPALGRGDYWSALFLVKVYRPICSDARLKCANHDGTYG